MRLYTCFAMVGLALIAAPAGARTEKTDNGPVLAAIKAFSDARARFDSIALDRLLTSDYIEVSPRGEVDRRSAVIGFYTADKASPAPPMVYSTENLRRYGDTAVVVGSIEYTIPAPNGEKVKRTVRATYVERRVGGRWLMASTQFTGVPPAQPAR